jgi:parallel beta-helix repeat protein
MKRLVLAILAGLFTPTAAAATTWYVAKTGSDSISCSQAQNPSTPRLTIGAALGCIGTATGVGADHTVEVWAGTYTESLSNMIPTGTSWSNPFTLRARSGDTVIIRPSSGGPVVRITAGAAQYSIIQGFVLDGINQTTGAGVVELSGSIRFVRLLDNEIKNGYSYGGNCANIVYLGVVTGIEILKNRLHDTLCGHVLYVEGSSNLAQGNELYNGKRYGIHNYSSIGGVYPSSNVYDSNWIHDTGTDDSRIAFAILLTTGNNNRASNNLVTNNQEGINVGPTSGNLVYNNTVYGNGVGHSNQCCYEAIRLDRSTSSIVQNNIVFGNASNRIYSDGTAQIDTNLFNNPAFVNAAGNDFRLQAGSPAIDTGVAISATALDFVGVPRPQGGGYDVGAYEYTSGSTAPAAPTNVRVIR